MSGCISGTWVRFPHLLHASPATDSIPHPSISLLSRTDAPICLASSSFSACPVGRPTSRSFYLVASPFFLFSTFISFSSASSQSLQGFSRVSLLKSIFSTHSCLCNIYSGFCSADMPPCSHSGRSHFFLMPFCIRIRQRCLRQAFLFHMVPA